MDATTDDGQSCRGAFALRAALPSTARLCDFSSSKEIVKLIGRPTHLPIDGDTDDQWAYDSVSWRLFCPVDSDTIDVIDASVARKSPLTQGGEPVFSIASYRVQRGTLKKSEQAGADQPATKPAEKVPAKVIAPNDRQATQPQIQPPFNRRASVDLGVEQVTVDPIVGISGKEFQIRAGQFGRGRRRWKRAAACSWQRRSCRGVDVCALGDELL